MELVDRALAVANHAYKKAGYDVRALSPSLQVVRLIDQLDFEVAHGGGYGWLVNEGGHGPDTVKALEAVGAYQGAAIVREMLVFFPEGTPAVDDMERVRQMEDIGAVGERDWSELGARLLAWPENIYMLLEKFVTAHEADFFDVKS